VPLTCWKNGKDMVQWNLYLQPSCFLKVKVIQKQTSDLDHNMKIEFGSEKK